MVGTTAINILSQVHKSWVFYVWGGGKGPGEWMGHWWVP